MNNSSSSSPKVKVIVRFRPLIGKKEKKSGLIKGAITYKNDPLNSNSVKLSSVVSMRNKTWNFTNFYQVYSSHHLNQEIFEKGIKQSLINQINNRGVLAYFAYGHTGSGKTHSTMGYGTELGLFHHSIKTILNHIEPYPDLLISLRFTELYNNRLFDLFNKKAECFVREDDNGNMVIRSQTIKNKKTGEVTVQSSKSFDTKSFQDCVKMLKYGIKQRAVGVSMLHSQSSRSHAILEIEIVSKQQIIQRKKLLQAEGEIVPIGQKRDDYMNANYKKLCKEINGIWQFVPDQKLKDLNKPFDIKMKEIEKLKKQEIEISKSHPLIGGKFIFVDLAGADHENCFKLDPKQKKESLEINKSLLSLKECIRKNKSGKGVKHVPYRNSKLTKFLKKFLIAKGVEVIMLANISQCDGHSTKTTNTLKYANLVANS